MKLTKTKTVILILLITVFVAGTVFGLCLSAVLEGENDKIKTHEGATEFIFSPGTQEETKLEVGESKKGYIIVKGDFAGYRLVSTKSDVAQFFAEKMTGNTRIYYNISAISVGEAVLYVETEDRKIKSEEIKITVVSDSEN